MEGSLTQNESPLEAQKESPSTEQQADNLSDAELFKLLEDYDDCSGLRNALMWIAKKRGDWAGIPMPVKDLSLVLDEKFPYAKGLIEQGLASSEAQSEKELADRGVKIRNQFYSWRYRTTITVFERNGKIDFRAEAYNSRARLEMDTLMATEAWGVHQEYRAITLLAELLPHHAFKKYLLCGMFLESSKKSGLSYMFRKLRPTIVLSSHNKKEEVRILCCLCMHPIGFYEGSWAGVMCPTDDVIAHLMMMRADERKFWSMCNQHHPIKSQSGLG